VVHQAARPVTARADVDLRIATPPPHMMMSPWIHTRSLTPLIHLHHTVSDTNSEW
jgi:hypothetical protein